MLRSVEFDVHPLSDMVVTHRYLAKKLEETRVSIEGSHSPRQVASLQERSADATSQRMKADEYLRELRQSIEEAEKRLKLLREKETKAQEVCAQALEAETEATPDLQELLDKPAATDEQLELYSNLKESFAGSQKALKDFHLV